MKYLHLVWAAFRRRKARTLLTFLSIVTAFFLFGALQTINAGIDSAMDFLNTSRLRVSSRVTLGQPLPFAHVARIAALPPVAAVTPISFIPGTYQRPNNVQAVLGVDLEAMFKLYPEMKIDPAQLAATLRTRSAVVVGKVLADKFGWKIGDRIPIHAIGVTKADGSSDFTFDVAGIYDMDPHEFAANIMGHYEYINEARSSGKDQVVQILVKIKDPSRSAQVSQLIDDTFANSPNQTMTQNEKDFISSILRQIGDISFLMNAIVGAVLFTLLFLTANTMAQSVRERIPELAVLKTVGFTDGGVQWLVLTEALVLSVVSALAGLGLAALVIPVIIAAAQLQGVPALHVPFSVFAAGVGFAVLLALVSGLPPAQRARRLQVAAALSGR
jgi:putative ABC transport system permease protein